MAEAMPVRPRDSGPGAPADLRHAAGNTTPAAGTTSTVTGSNGCIPKRCTSSPSPDCNAAEGHHTTAAPATDTRLDLVQQPSSKPRPECVQTTSISMQGLRVLHVGPWVWPGMSVMKLAQVLLAGRHVPLICFPLAGRMANQHAECWKRQCQQPHQS